jgi:predicted lipid-binding transport protein (Tim44 family)
MVRLASREPALAGAELPKFKVRFSELEDAMGAATEEIETAANREAQASAEGAAFGRLLMGCAMGLGLLLGAILVLFSRLAVVRPIQALTEDMRQLATGRTEIALAGAARTDEVARRRRKPPPSFAAAKPRSRPRTGSRPNAPPARRSRPRLWRPSPRAWADCRPAT